MSTAALEPRALTAAVAEATAAHFDGALATTTAAGAPEVVELWLDGSPVTVQVVASETGAVTLYRFTDGADMVLDRVFACDRQHRPEVVGRVAVALLTERIPA